MPMPFHMTVTGKNQGDFGDGGLQANISGRPGSLCQAAHHTVLTPRDIQTGLPTGKRQHQPFKVTKEIDKLTPKIYHALCTGEQLSDVTFKYYIISPQGTETNYYTVKLVDAIIVEVTHWVPNCHDSSMSQFRHEEDVSYTYRHIEWTWEDGGIMATDDWTTPQ